jgi:hypothetical protein
MNLKNVYSRKQKSYNIINKKIIYFCIFKIDEKVITKKVIIKKYKNVIS